MNVNYCFVWLLVLFWLFVCIFDFELLLEIELEFEFVLFFIVMDLLDFFGFQLGLENWAIVGGVYVDCFKLLMMELFEGMGVVVNIVFLRFGVYLFIVFEYGDIELELEVMIVKNFNFGIYLQGCYEVQVFDSWGVKILQYFDMGGIYQCWDDDVLKDKCGYESYLLVMNVVKVFGLWQQVCILFYVFWFDDNGQKVQNVEFWEVWFNGIKVYENVELIGLICVVFFMDEVFIGFIMLQGDYGLVVYCNI